MPVVVSLVAEADAPPLIKQPLTVPPDVKVKVTAEAALVVTFVGVVPVEVAADHVGD